MLFTVNAFTECVLEKNELVCENPYLKTIDQLNHISLNSLPVYQNREWGFHKTFIAKTGCAVGCAISAPIYFLFRPNTDNMVNKMKEEFPYERLKGKTLTYKYGLGGKAKYRINTQEDYNSMMKDARKRFYENERFFNDTVGNGTALTCLCSITITF